MRTADAALARLCDPEAKVSAHYVVDGEGRMVRLVDEKKRAWHAGASCWQGRERLNDCSIGIEIVNPGHEWGYRPFTEAQYRALEWICPAIMKRWSIPPGRVLAHSDVAPDRKEDPGELFDWRRLAASGIGIWPEDGAGTPRPVDQAIQQLHAIGYSLPDPGDSQAATRRVAAFQRRFRPERVDGELDRQTLARLDGLLALIEGSSWNVHIN
ncbi:MAG: N-acetylmuramoyl-L-alanine amidase [Rhizobiales bacterium]|nr:N-acetylmuramoyl-L-alanine amidase [Hyphomicrobiales bacterium]